MKFGALCFLLGTSATTTSAAAIPTGPSSFDIYSEPIELRYGQVHNRMQGVLPLPADVVARYANGSVAMAVSSFTTDIVRIAADGSETQVPLYEAYLHHYILNVGTSSSLGALRAAARSDPALGSMKQGAALKRRQAAQLGAGDAGGNTVSFGGAAGGEYRNNPHDYQAPFRAIVYQPEAFMPTLHVINTLRSGGAEREKSALLQCPCTPQRHFNLSAGTIDGEVPFPRFGNCEGEIVGNPSCQLETYVGGWRCCAHGVFLVDTDKECAHDPACLAKPVDRVFVKFTFQYDDATAADRMLEPVACCDATSTVAGDTNIEYDVPLCPAGTDPRICTQTVVTTQPFDYYYNDAVDGEALVDLAFAAPHLHVTALSLTLQDAITSETLCHVERGSGSSGGVLYGNGTEPGNENGYLVGLLPCTWNGSNAPRLKRSHPLRTTAVYNASTYQTGVMSLWLMNGAQVSDRPACSTALQASGCLAAPNTPSTCLACAQINKTAAALVAAGCGDVDICFSDRCLINQLCAAAPQQSSQEEPSAMFLE